MCYWANKLAGIVSLCKKPQWLVVALLLISPYELSAESVESLKKRFPQNNIRLTLDGAGWLLKTPNFSGGYRQGAEYYGVMYQQHSFDVSSEQYKWKTLGVDFKRYVQNHPFTLRVSLHYLKVDVKNSFDSVSVKGWQMEPQIGYRHFIEPSFWLEAFVGVKFIVLDAINMYKYVAKQQRQRVQYPSKLKGLQPLIRLEASYEFGLPNRR